MSIESRLKQLEERRDSEARGMEQRSSLRLWERIARNVRRVQHGGVGEAHGAAERPFTEEEGPRRSRWREFYEFGE